MLTHHDLVAIVLAVIFGSAVGLEREMSGKAAGLRTNLLICLGAAVFTVISRQMAAEAADSLTRIAAQVVTGVGFLGAGAIIVDRGGIYGLTTAATIWLVASIGTACGAHLYALAALVTFIALLALLGLAQLEIPLQRYGKKRKQRSQPDTPEQTNRQT